MRATFNPDELRAAFALAASIAPARSPKEVLQSVKLSVGPDGATLEATDLEVAVRVRVEGAEVDGPGAALLPTARFGAILRTWGGGPIPVESDGDSLKVGSGRAAYKLNAGDPSLFPAIPAAPSTLRHEVDADALATALRRTAFACDPESARYALGGVLFEPDPDDAGRLLLVATDGRRLARAEIAAKTDGEPGGATRVVPVKAVKLLLRCLPGGGPVALAFDGRSMAATIGGVEAWSRLVEGRFPAYRDVFPSGVPHRAAFEAGALRAAVEQAAVTTGDESRGVDFALSAGSLRLSARAADAGESAVECDAGYDGPAVAFALDPAYLLDMLRSLDAETPLTLAAIDGRNAIVLTTDDGTYSYVAMPLTREA